MKHEWNKQEKAIYLPSGKPELTVIPEFKFFTIEGKGNPNDSDFVELVGVLYALSYGIKMLPKKGLIPQGYFEYSIYPLEGIWDLTDEAKEKGIFDKNELVYKIMIRQPGFVTEELAKAVIHQVKVKKPHPLMDNVQFETIEDGMAVQMLHLGSYDEEPESFSRMDAFCTANGLERTKLSHREIYLTDARKTSAEKLKTVLRYFVQEKIK